MPRLVAVLALTLLGGCGTAPAQTDQPIFPTEAGGFPMLTVTQALAARDSGRPGPYAIAGWFSQGPLHGCPAPLRQPSPLELYCYVGESGLSEVAEAVVTVRVAPNSISMSGNATQGPVIQPLIETSEPIFPAGWDETWQPIAVVLVGHFGDPRAIQCPPDEFRACHDRFVATDVVWRDGQSVR